jgi:hypothetical protein
MSGRVGIVIARMAAVDTGLGRWCSCAIDTIGSAQSGSIELALLRLPPVLEIIVVVVMPRGPHLLNRGRREAFGYNGLDESNTL